MYKLLFFFALFIVGTFADDAGDISVSVETLCLKPQGLQLQLEQYFDEIEKSKSDILTPEVEDKLACALACIFVNEKPIKASLHDLVTSALNRIGLDVTEDKREELLHLANNCHIQAGEDLCKYLRCIKITKHPMANLIFVHNLEKNKSKQ